MDEELRFADGPTAEASVDVDAPATAVWPYISDIELPAQFSNEFRGAEWLDGASGPVLGARFAGRNEHEAVGTWETTSTVTACDPPWLFEWTVGDVDRPAATWRFTVREAGDGVAVTQWVRLGPGPSGTTAVIERMPDKESRIIRYRLRELRGNMEATLAGIKRLAEHQ